MKIRMIAITCMLSAFSAATLSSAANASVDAAAAKALAKSNDCFKCHAVDKDKKGASFKKIAAKYKGKADGEEKIIKSITTGPKVKMLDDNKEEDHSIIETKDMGQLKNLANWILSQ